jgi:Protein of unknown function (DUF3631)
MNNSAPSSGILQPGDVFPERDPLAEISAAFVGPEIAVELGLAPISAPQLADVISATETFIRRFCILPVLVYLPLAVWVVATYVSNAFDTFPYVALLSPAKRCGKTRVLEVLELICARAWRGTSPTSAALYRMMGTSPTLLLDEMEPLRGKQVSEMQKAILAVLNAGHRRGATIPRCDGPKNEVKHFPVYGPKAFAVIGRLPDTLSDRSICITMQRKTEPQVIERFLFTRASMDALPLKEMLAAWAQEHEEDVRTAYTQMPDLGFLIDRDADLWMPLFAVCAVVAPDRVGELKPCALALTGAKADDDLDDSLSLKLLDDMRTVWNAGAAHMTTSSLLEKLNALSESPWGEFGMVSRKLARMLRPFGVKPRQVRIGALGAKGYVYHELEEAFSRYLPPWPVLPETYDTTRMDTA